VQDTKSKNYAAAQRLRQQFGHAHTGPFSQALSSQDICAIADRQPGAVRQRLYPPLTTLGLFIGQVLSPDPACQTATASHLAQRVSQGQRPCSANNASYCQARKRLPKALVSDLGALLGQRLEALAPIAWRWQGRCVKLFDGTSVSMPDTTSNQAAYPQSRSQAEGVGFPMVRIGALIGLASGAVLAYDLTALRGKGTGEQTVLYGLLEHIQPGDIILADALLATWWLIQAIQSRGGDVVMAQHGRRSSDFAQGQILGRRDHIVQWRRPPRPEWMGHSEYAALPQTLRMREIEVQGRVLVSTLCDSRGTSAQALDQLYGMRWNIEVDFRSLKATMAMDVLRCKSSEMVDKEIAAYLLAFNLVRWAMGASAVLADVLPRALSFASAKRLLSGFAQQLIGSSDGAIAGLCSILLRSMATLKLVLQPGRIEPRAKKRRPKPLPLLKLPRQAARAMICNRRGLS
jgi:hypothetical protein